MFCHLQRRCLRASPAGYLNPLLILYLGSEGQKTHSSRLFTWLPTFIGPTKFFSHYLHLLDQQICLAIFSPSHDSLSPSTSTHARARRSPTPRCHYSLPCLRWRGASPRAASSPRRRRCSPQDLAGGILPPLPGGACPAPTGHGLPSSLWHTGLPQLLES
jgi:hypothetical protein